MRQTFRDPDLQAEFERRGFVVVPLLTPAEAAQYRAEMEGLLPAQAEINDAPGALYSTLFDPERRKKGQERAQDILEVRLLSLLQDYKMQGACVMAKVPQSGFMAQHQHNPMTDDMFEPVLQGWCTLDDVDEESGALRIVPGSHQIVRHIQSFHSPSFFARGPGKPYCSNGPSSTDRRPTKAIAPASASSRSSFRPRADIASSFREGTIVMKR
jgi:hypothetical protein